MIQVTGIYRSKGIYNIIVSDGIHLKKVWKNDATEFFSSIFFCMLMVMELNVRHIGREFKETTIFFLRFIWERGQHQSNNNMHAVSSSIL